MMNLQSKPWFPVRAGLFVLVAGLCLISAGARAQDRTAELEQRVKALEQQVEILEIMLSKSGIQIPGPDSIKSGQDTVSVRHPWDALRIGMSEAAVRTLLGEPARLQTLSSLTYWFYEGGSAYIRPHVSFDEHLVYGWTGP